MTTSCRFPPSFLWGAATSAYQVEGSPLANGAGASIWHRFVRTPGRVANGDTGDIACDHYRRMEDDVAMMKALGLTAYRFSIAWGRVLPSGRGPVNEAGLHFYERLVDRLLECGIEPLPTLYHWDLPAALDDRGGWLNPDSADWFADYARVLFRRLDGRVRKWTTLNEPWVAVDGGYLRGELAPGHRSLLEAPIATHHLLRAHGRAVQAYRAEGAHAIGIVVNLAPKHAATDRPEDIAAARRADAYLNRQYLDPIFRGAYPPEMGAEIFGAAWPDWPTADFELIGQPIDFVGVNYYTRDVIRHDPNAWPVRTAAVPQPYSTTTETGWEVYPAGLTEILVWLRDRYGPIPLYVTENGAAFPDSLDADGSVHDPLRVAYHRNHLRAAHAAIEQGVDLRGYCAWSLMDNLEWSLGYAKRFGLVRVDFASQARTWKDSARFYASVIASHGAVLGDVD